jgi:hypothetical protein
VYGDPNQITISSLNRILLIHFDACGGHKGRGCCVPFIYTFPKAVLALLHMGVHFLGYLASRYVEYVYYITTLNCPINVGYHLELRVAITSY